MKKLIILSALACAMVSCDNRTRYDGKYEVTFNNGEKDTIDIKNGVRVELSNGNLQSVHTKWSIGRYTVASGVRTFTKIN